MLYRTAAARSALRALSSSNASVARSTVANTVFRAQLTSSARYPARPIPSPTMALAARKPVTTALIRHVSSASGSSNVSESHCRIRAGESLISMYRARKRRTPT